MVFLIIHRWLSRLFLLVVSSSNGLSEIEPPPVITVVPLDCSGTGINGSVCEGLDESLFPCVRIISISSGSSKVSSYDLPSVATVDVV